MGFSGLRSGFLCNFKGICNRGRKNIENQWVSQQQTIKKNKTIHNEVLQVHLTCIWGHMHGLPFSELCQLDCESMLPICIRQHIYWDSTVYRAWDEAMFIYVISVLCYFKVKMF